MDALFNASTLQAGGALQVCVNLLIQSLRDTDTNWTYLISPAVSREIDKFEVQIVNQRLFVIKDSPSKSKEARLNILKIAESVNPDAVLTVFGPAYVKFPQPHLMGFADGWTTHATWSAYARVGGVKEGMRRLLVSMYRGFWTRCADAWIVEAEPARDGLATRWRLPKEKISIIPNNSGAEYSEYEFKSVSADSDREFNVLTMASYYPHKNLEMVPLVAKWLYENGPKGKFNFRVTLDPESAGWAKVKAAIARSSAEELVTNIGQVAITDGPRTFDGADIMFLPSLLETFSASYPEAMAAGRPIVTSDLGFARDICGDSAVYFEAGNVCAAAKALISVATSAELRARLIEKGRARLKLFPTPEEKYLRYKERLIHCASFGPELSTDRSLRPEAPIAVRSSAVRTSAQVNDRGR